MLKKAGCSTCANVNDDYMLFNNALTTGGVKRLRKSKPKAKKVEGALKPKVKKNGKKRGGAFMDQLLNSTSALSSALQQPQAEVKGGAVELAPFAAALAFLATRFATDKNFNIKKMFGKS